MGTYVNFVAREGCEDQINAAYARLVGDEKQFIVYSEAVIRKEIEYIQSPAGDDQAHLRYIKTVEDWNRVFGSVMGSGRGQIKISGLDEEYELEEWTRLKRDIAFLIEHFALFKKIDGLDDARERGLTSFAYDGFENGKPVKRQKPVPDSFATLERRSNDRLYQACVKHSRPDLWKRLLAFFESMKDETERSVKVSEKTLEAWTDLRSATVPWVEGYHSVWQLCERKATEMDGLSYGLTGRFQKNYPSRQLLELALNPGLVLISSH